MITLITTILGFILPLIADWMESRDKDPNYAQDKQKFDSYLASSDAPGLSALFEQLHRPHGGSDSSRPDNHKVI